VPLSDRERKLLAEMEQALSADDPRLSSTLTGNRTFPGRGRVLTGLGALLSGLAIILGGLISQTVPVGIFGFVIALTGLFTALSALSALSKAPRMAKTKKGSGLRSRLEQRWDERNYDN
jgi:hypothetical protein